MYKQYHKDLENFPPFRQGIQGIKGFGLAPLCFPHTSLLVLWRIVRACIHSIVYIHYNIAVCLCVYKSFRLTNKPCIFASKLLFTHVNGTPIKDIRPHIHTHTHTHTLLVPSYIIIIYIL